MPHVIVENSVGLREVAARFERVEQREQRGVIKISHCLLDTGGRHALLECLVVEGRLRRKFYIRLDQRDEGIKVSLDPMTDPEKTNGVKRALARVGSMIREMSPGSSYGRTNLEPFLGEG